MAYRNRTRQHSRTRARGFTSPSNQYKLKNYANQQTTTLRHQTQSVNTEFASIAAGSYATYHIARLFRAGVAATASNNVQSNKVNNGSTIGNLKLNIYAKSLSSSTTFKIDVYSVALSFYDALIWDTVQPTYCPVTFSTVGGAEGNVTFDTPSATVIVPNAINNFTFLQHYIKRVGSLILTPTDGADSVATLQLTKFPAKVRRSQTGMFYGLIFHNDSDTNGAGTFTGIMNCDLSFDEYPSDSGMPYLY